MAITTEQGAVMTQGDVDGLHARHGRGRSNAGASWRCAMICAAMLGASCRHPVDGPGGGPTAACLAQGKRCAAALQCCSNRCEVSPRGEGGTCTSSDELDGPLAALPAFRKRDDLRLSPPRVLDASAIAGPDGQSIVQVAFRDDARLGPTVTLPTEDGPLVLHDDGTAGDAKAGDRSYAAVVPVAFAALQAQERETLAELARRGVTSTPIFDGPELVGTRAIDFAIDPSRVRFLDPVPAFDVKRTLLVTDLGVVEDPARTFNPCASTGTAMGKWTFGDLMSQIANQPATGSDPADLVLDWLGLWNTVPIVNGFGSPRRAGIADLIANWPRVAATGKLDLARAPLKLLAIVNRIDLAGNPSYGRVGGAEGRFVFGVLGPNCTALQFTVILEYGVPRRTCGALRDWALAWEALDAMAPGSAAYNAALEALTEQFARANADPGKPAGSALDQLRTDEVSLVASIQEAPQWELREFALQPTPAGIRLRQATVKQTPDERFNAEREGARSADLATWINANQAAILAETHTVPDALPFPPGDSFLAASTLNFFNLINGNHHRDFWTANGILSNEARHRFSRNTCNGCHGEETRTAFLHINRAGFGTEATLSGFLTGETIADPVVASTSRTFHELSARAVKLAQLAGATCRRRDLEVLVEARVPPRFPLPPLAHRPDLRAH